MIAGQQGNSQMALNPETWTFLSARTHPTPIRTLAMEVVAERRAAKIGSYRIDIIRGRAPYILCRPVDADSGAALAWEKDYCLTFTSSRQCREWMHANLPHYCEGD